MTATQHLAWYNLILANMYSIAGNQWAFLAFLLVSVILFIGGFFEGRR